MSARPLLVGVASDAWGERIPLSAEDKTKILSGNAKRLLKM